MPPFIAELNPSIPNNLATESADAHAALSAFDARVGGVPAPLAAILLRTE